MGAPRATERWYELAVGKRGVIQVRASSANEARQRAQAELEELGIVPGRLDRRASWLRLVRNTN